MQFTFFILKTFKNLLPSKLKTIDFVENLEMTQVYGDGGGGGGGGGGSFTLYNYDAMHTKTDMLFTPKIR